MRVNSDETIRRATAYRREANASWLELSRRPAHQRFSRTFFTGGRSHDEAHSKER